MCRLPKQHHPFSQHTLALASTSLHFFLPPFMAAMCKKKQKCTSQQVGAGFVQGAESTDGGILLPNSFELGLGGFGPGGGGGSAAAAWMAQPVDRHGWQQKLGPFLQRCILPCWEEHSSSAAISSGVDCDLFQRGTALGQAGKTVSVTAVRGAVGGGGSCHSKRIMIHACRLPHICSHTCMGDCTINLIHCHCEPLPQLPLPLLACGCQHCRCCCCCCCAGQPLVLFFYPKAATPGCTKEVRQQCLHTDTVAYPFGLGFTQQQQQQQRTAASSSSLCVDRFA
jgi:hypothetical protein